MVFILFKEFGDKKNETVILLHGGGLSWWSLTQVAEQFEKDYHVVTPIIDGHGEDGGAMFTSIEDSATTLIRYIDAELGGKIFALGGLSLGAQITVEVLSRRPDIARFAVIESALVIPMKAALNAEWLFNISYGLISKRWFSKLQAKSLCISPEQFERYYKDSLEISKLSLLNIANSNASYAMKDSLRNTKAKTLVIVGSKELGIMKKSADALHTIIPENTLHVAQGMKHGEMSLVNTAAYLQLVSSFFNS